MPRPGREVSLKSREGYGADSRMEQPCAVGALVIGITECDGRGQGECPVDPGSGVRGPGVQLSTGCGSRIPDPGSSP